MPRCVMNRSSVMWRQLPRHSHTGAGKRVGVVGIGGGGGRRGLWGGLDGLFDSGHE